MKLLPIADLRLPNEGASKTTTRQSEIGNRALRIL